MSYQMMRGRQQVPDLRPITVVVDIEGCRIPKSPTTGYYDSIEYLIPSLRDFLGEYNLAGTLDLIIVVGDASNARSIPRVVKSKLEDLVRNAQNRYIGVTVDLIDMISGQKQIADFEIKKIMGNWMSHTKGGVFVLAACDGGYAWSLGQIDSRRQTKDLEVFLLYEPMKTSRRLLDIIPVDKRMEWHTCLWFGFIRRDMGLHASELILIC